LNNYSNYYCSLFILGSDILANKIKSIQDSVSEKQAKIIEDLKDMESRNTAENKKDKQDWLGRVATQEEDWEKKRPSFIKSRVSAYYSSDRTCTQCYVKMSLLSAYCFCCERNYCASCDLDIHLHRPFHKRILQFHEEYSSYKLKPTTFINLDGSRYETGIDIPLQCSLTYDIHFYYIFRHPCADSNAE
jgi:excinuclease UvrABC ATPase subunit